MHPLVCFAPAVRQRGGASAAPPRRVVSLEAAVAGGLGVVGRAID